MNNEDAKKILSFYRPNTADQHDPDFLAALELVRRAPDNARWLAQRDPELAKWFAEHNIQYEAGRARFQSIPVPAGLKEQILAERNVVRLPVARKRAPMPLLALAAAIAVLLCMLPFVLRHESPTALTACRNQMVRTALSPYAMDLESSNQDRIRAYLAERNAPANYALPPGMGSAQMVGCGVKSWENTPVAMICFRSGRPLRPGDNTDLWLFVIDNNSLAGAPVSNTPAFAQVSRAITATWSHDQRTYILVGSGDRAFLEKYL
ncbi:MAG TPA: hypothetical protein VHB20_07655 [Verrucomicrobiae bacterium]|nr:hypothetical protein [Verrucomicrobiae bacterium]